jgi:hypothetical protein
MLGVKGKSIGQSRTVPDGAMLWAALGFCASNRDMVITFPEHLLARLHRLLGRSGDLPLSDDAFL